MNIRNMDFRQSQSLRPPDAPTLTGSAPPMAPVFIYPLVHGDWLTNERNQRSIQDSEIWNSVPNGDMIQYISKKIK